MSNKPNFRRAPNLAEYVDRRREEGAIEIPMSDGDPIVVPPREFWTREVKELLDEQRSQRRRRDTIATSDDDIVKALLGDDDFARFAAEVEQVAGPGQDVGGFFWRYWAEAVKEQQGVTEGE